MELVIVIKLVMFGVVRIINCGKEQIISGVVEF